MAFKQEGASVIDANHLVDAVAELEPPILNGNLRLVDRAELAVEPG